MECWATRYRSLARFLEDVLRILARLNIMNLRLLWITILGSTIANAQDITIRVISAKDGHPFTEEPVRLVVAETIDRPAGHSLIVSDLTERTDGEGKAVFRVEVPQLASLSVLTKTHIQCSPVTYQSEHVRRTGVAQQQCPHRPQGKFGLPLRPGEIVIYIGEYSKLERMLYFPWPG